MTSPLERPGRRHGRRAARPPRPEPWSGRRFVALLVSGILAVAGSGLLVWQGTAAVFRATTTNPSNSWTLGSVALTDDDSGTALFAATGLTPGGTGSNCIAVTYNGDVATTVRLYATGASDPDTIAQYLDLTVEEGSGGGFGSCAGFSTTATLHSGTLAAFTSTRTDYGSGAGTWSPSTAGTTRVFRFTYTLAAGTPDDRQGKTTSVGFRWESQA